MLTIAELIAAKKAAPATDEPDKPLIRVEESVREELACGLFYSFCLLNLSSHHWRLLAMYMGCYDYVLPADRGLNPALLDALYKRMLGICLTDTHNAHTVFQFWGMADILNSCFSSSAQDRLLKIFLDKQSPKAYNPIIADSPTDKDIL